MLENYIANSYLIPLLPLIGAAIAGFLGAKWLKGQSHWPIWLCVGGSAFVSLAMLVGVIDFVQHNPGKQMGQYSHWFDWISAGSFQVSAGAWIDPLTVTMLAVVCGIGFFICVFAAGYMKGEDGYFRFFAYLGLFIFAMTCLVMGNNLIMLYLGWEGVGLCSYLLIGYYYHKPAAREAAKKAFLVNRIGDFGFGVGIMFCFLAFGTVNFFPTHEGGKGLLELAMHPATPLQQWAVSIIPFCLMLGAFGKSAQFPLYVWLPDAMEGPTPVSALIHAATMVTAGVYMIARCGVFFAQSEAASLTVAVVGAFTAIYAGSIALRQFDLKKVFAYSTVSQLGFMFVGVGVLAPVAGVFHLITHAFFKALLFLSSGVVMHAMLGELDLRKMSGLKVVLPTTRWLVLIGCCALAGFPLLSGFYSKDEIIAAAWHRHWSLGLVLLVTALMTAYYTFRLYFRVFEGPLVVPAAPAGGHGHGHGHDDSHDSAADAGKGKKKKKKSEPQHEEHHGHSHEPLLMILPLLVLAVGAIVSGYLLQRNEALGQFLGRSASFAQTYEVASHHGQQVGHEVNPLGFGQEDKREKDVKEAEHGAHVNMMIVSGCIALAGIGLAFYFHLKNRRAGDALPGKFPQLNTAMENKYWVDEFYQGAFVEPLRTLGKFFFAIDRIVVDGLVWAVGFVPQLSGFTLKLTTQRGYLQGYAAAMLFGILIILLIVFL